MLASSSGVVKILNMNLYRKIRAIILCYTMKTLFLGFVVMFTSSCLSNVGGRDCERCAQIQFPKSKTIHAGYDKPVVNVYMENSGSMFGYVDGLTEFEASVYSYLSDIANTSTDSLNLFYINSRIIPQQSIELSNSKKIKDFISKLSPSHFVHQGGNLGTTDVSDMIYKILKKTDNRTVSVFISDCVFSPGKNQNANDYLINQQIGIKSAFSDKLKQQKDLSVLVYRLNGRFKGSYYNCFDSPTNIDDVRPFYMILIGKENLLNAIVKNVPEEKIKGRGVESTAFFSKVTHQSYYEILGTPKQGTFKRCMRHSKYHIYEAERSSKGRGQGQFMFSIGIDFSELPLSSSFLLQPENYKLKDNDYALSISKTSNDNRFTHVLKLSLADKISEPAQKNMDIVLRQGFPSWIEKYTDFDGVDIKKDDNMSKTYGLKFLLEGIYEAYSYNGNVDFSRIRVIIN